MVVFAHDAVVFQQLDIEEAYILLAATVDEVARRIAVEIRPPSRIHDKLLDAELRAIRNAGMAKRAAWSMQGMCNALERAGLDTSYWRGLADDILGRVE